MPEDSARAAEIGWLRDHAAAYAGRWVALRGPQLLGSATTLQALLGILRTQEQGTPPLLHFVQRAEEEGENMTKNQQRMWLHEQAKIYTATLRDAERMVISQEERQRAIVGQAMIVALLETLAESTHPGLPGLY